MLYGGVRGPAVRSSSVGDLRAALRTVRRGQRKPVLQRPKVSPGTIVKREKRQKWLTRVVSPGAGRSVGRPVHREHLARRCGSRGPRRTLHWLQTEQNPPLGAAGMPPAAEPVESVAVATEAERGSPEPEPEGPERWATLTEWSDRPQWASMTSEGRKEWRTLTE